MVEYVKELLTKKVVLVPFALSCAFIAACYQMGINDFRGGEMVFKNRQITDMYFYLEDV